MKKCRFLIASAGLVVTPSICLGQTPANATDPATPPTEAQSQVTGGLEEIVVTAQRRNERLQDVPISVTAVTAARLTQAGATSAVDIGALTPSLNVPATQAYFQPRIRGVGTLAFGPGIENPIATYIDGVYLALAQTSLLNFEDVDRVEVVKGPQGTLFGRNATGGLIQFITRDPKPGFGGSFDVSYGNYSAVRTNVSLYGGSEAISAIVTGFYNYQGDGYGRDLVLNRDTNRLAHDKGVRGKVVFKPTDKTTIKIAGDYVQTSGTYPDVRPQVGTSNLFGAVPGGIYDTDNDVQGYSRFSGGGASLNVTQDLDAVKVVSITAYRRSRYFYQIDFDGTRNPFGSIFNTEHDHQFSQELHLESGAASRINWIIGGFYFDSYGDFDPSRVNLAGPLVSPMLPITALTTVGAVKSRSFAGFGQVTVPLGEKVRITGGLRYTTERRSIDATQTLTVSNLINIPIVSAAHATFNKLTFRAALDYRINPSVLLYASVNRGFKSGGFNILSPADPSYKPETLNAYEVGTKAEFLDHKLRINPALFYYDYKDLQVPFANALGQVGIANGASARLYGADLDVEIVPFRQLHFFGGASYINNEFRKFPDAVVAIPLPGGAGFTQTTGDASGNRIPFTSKFSGNVGAEYTIPLKSGRLSLNTNVYYNSGYRLEPDNREKQHPFEQVSASLGWTSDNERLSVRLWGKNLTKAKVYTQFSTSPVGTATSYQPPRTYGFTIGSKF